MSNDSSLPEVCCLCFPDAENRLKKELNLLIERYKANEKECFYVVCQVTDTKNNQDSRLQLTRKQYNSLNLIGKDVLVEHAGEPCGRVVLSWHRHLDHENYGICAVLEINKAAFPDIKRRNLRTLCGEVSLATTGKEKKALEVSLVNIGARPGTVAEYPENLKDLITEMHLQFGFAQYGKCYKESKLKKMRLLNTLKLSNEEIIRASKKEVEMDSNNGDHSSTPTMDITSEEGEEIGETLENDDRGTSETVLEKFEKDIKEMPSNEIFHFLSDLYSELYNTKERAKETDQMLNTSSDGMNKIFCHVTRGLNQEDKPCKKLIDDWNKLKKDSKLGTKHFSEDPQELTRRTNKQLEILQKLSTHIPTYNKTSTKEKLWEYMLEAGVIPKKTKDEIIGEKTNPTVRASIKKMGTPQQYFYTSSDGGQTFNRVSIVPSMNNTCESSTGNEYHLGDARKVFNSSPQQQQQQQQQQHPQPIIFQHPVPQTFFHQQPILQPQLQQQQQQQLQQPQQQPMFA